jgi:hypothetical protein
MAPAYCLRRAGRQEHSLWGGSVPVDGGSDRNLGRLGPKTGPHVPKSPSPTSRFPSERRHFLSPEARFLGQGAGFRYVKGRMGVEVCVFVRHVGPDPNMRGGDPSTGFRRGGAFSDP